MNRVLMQVEEAKLEISKYVTIQPAIGLILGSGLGELADEIENPVILSFGQIPHFPVSTVEGHAGRLVCGLLEGKPVIAMQGRFHYYEGYPMEDVVFPVRVMKALGVELLMVTNACGGMNPAFSAGDLMVISDHLNVTGDNPLIGPNTAEWGPRFPDMSRAYDPELIRFAGQKAEQLGITLRKGVYAGITGPAYMTPAELKMLRIVGADAVGMSTVPEVIVARHMNMRVLGISCITDMAIAETLEALTHEQVVAVANRTKPLFKQLMKKLVSEASV